MLRLRVAAVALLAFAVVLGASASPAPAARSSRKSRRLPVVTDARCTPAASCPANPHQVRPGGRLALTGSRLRPGMTVLFRARASATGSPGSSTVSARLRRSTGALVVAVPATAATGRIIVAGHGGKRSAPFGPIYIVRHQSHRKHAITPSNSPASPTGSPFDGGGMWIWHVSNSDGGSPDAIASRAKAAGIGTIFIKSADGSTNYWSQFSADLVSALKSRGLKVCGWQYVYGRSPEGEADLGARAVKAGADCLVIDAEAEYEGRYAAAQRYIRRLRADVGPNLPVGLASFPYVDYHPQLPYSVFLGPGGAQYNAPQMYWKAIGTSVDTVYSHTWLHNRIYGRSIFPLGQTYQSPSHGELIHFRELAQEYGFTGLSWWDWEETSSAGWAALGETLPSAGGGFTPSKSFPNLGPGSKGDEVIWLQEHLASASPSTPTSGVFDSATEQALTSFQSAHGLTPTGRTDAQTWTAVLGLAPVPVDWTGGGGTGGGGNGPTGGGGSGTTGGGGSAGGGGGGSGTTGASASGGTAG
ncbi:MAG TPA: peptidoglycan-binding domain-containing protein [Solirubrobacteraceae bacterium]|jgi:hypothetical protein|nr:peptidoglycan-binding domain-containing protein [Solirubrobacteraceae bacterium]